MPRWISRCIPALAAVLLLALPAAAQTLSTRNAIQRDGSAVTLKTASCSVVPEKELFITHLSVVEDCYRTTWSGPCLAPYPQPLPATRGAWTFGALMQGVAGTTDPVALDRFTRDWLSHWQRDLLINGDGVPKRLAIQNHVITPWEKASGSKVLDMKKAPFRLLAIVARLDLRDASGGYGAANTAGEGRFVFGLADPANDQVAKELTVIFEYRLDARDCQDIQQWANQWHALGTYAFGHQYNAALQAVTDRFTTIGAAPGSPNGSAISQVRTNEIILASPWELREFRLSASRDVATLAPVPLVQTTVARTPNTVHQKQQILANFINANEALILQNEHDVPLSFQFTSFRGGHSPHSLQLGWDGPGTACSSINNDEARHIFSRETCSGCHGDAETGTIFYQVFPRPAGQVAQLAPFLTGAAGGGSFFKTDICGRTHGFDDIERRRRDLCNLLASSCVEIAEEEPLLIVH